MSEPDCPGRFKCHGPAGWCPECGDVDLICDDPECEVHLRLIEKEEVAKEARMKFLILLESYKSAKKELEQAEEQLKRHRTGGGLMVNRGKNFTRKGEI